LTGGGPGAVTEERGGAEEGEGVELGRSPEDGTNPMLPGELLFRTAAGVVETRLEVGTEDPEEKREVSIFFDTLLSSKKLGFFPPFFLGNFGSDTELKLNSPAADQRRRNSEGSSDMLLLREFF